MSSDLGEIMKKKKGKAGKIIGGIVLIVVAALGITAGVYHKAAYAVFKNLTVKTVKLDESKDWDGGKAYEKLSYAEDSENQYVDLYVPDMEDGSKPKLFVMIHGGGFVFNDAQSRQAQLMYRYFRDHGFACASVNYRLAQEAEFPGAVSDCKAAIRFLVAHAEEYGYDAEHFAVWGESAGGYLATMCAVTDDDEFTEVAFIGQEEAGEISAKPDVLVDYYGHVENEGAEKDWKELEIPGFVRSIANSWISGSVLEGYEDLQSFWARKNFSEMTSEEKAWHDPYTYINKNSLEGMSAWIIHGDCDLTVSYLQSQRLAEVLSNRLGEDNVHFQLVPGMGHASDMLFSEELLEPLAKFLRERL